MRCECGKSRTLAAAAKRSDLALGFCQGQRPWLGKASREKCGGADGKSNPNWLLVRSASNSYFPQLLSVISIPDPDEQLRKAIDSVWDLIETVETPDELKYERKKAKVRSALEDLKDDAVLAEIKRRRSGADKPWKPIKQAEIEMLLNAQETFGEDSPEGDFYARALKPDVYPKWLGAKLSRVVLVHRLKEVVAQVGFTRFEAASPTVDGELDVNVKRAELATDVSWLPAIENRGEGVFLGFRAEAIAEWVKRPRVAARGATITLAGFNAWRRSHSRARKLNFRVSLTSCSTHCLICSSPRCHWNAVIPRPRFASGFTRVNRDMASCFTPLLPTPKGPWAAWRWSAAQDQPPPAQRPEDGPALLPQRSRKCAQHRPDNPQEERFLHGAACHGCLLIAETSCERYNEYLDRELVVPTVMATGVEFFEDAGS